MTSSGSNSSPPPGFYPDPENPNGPQRWWSGSGWTSTYQTPMPPPPPGAMPTQFGGPQSTPSYPGGGYDSGYGGPSGYGAQGMGASGMPTISDVVGAGWKNLTRRWKPVLLISFLCLGIPYAIFGAMIPSFIRAVGTVVEALELEDGLNMDAVPVSGFLQIGLAGLLLGLLALIGQLACSALAIDADDNHGDRTSFGAAWPALKHGLVRAPAMIGWVILIYLVLVAVFFVATIPAGFFPPLAIITVIAAYAFGVYVAIKLGFLPFAVVERRPNPIGVSASISNGRFWAVFGRLFVLGLVVFGVGWLLSLLIQLVLLLFPSEQMTVVGSDQQWDVEFPGVFGFAFVSFLLGTVGGLIQWGMFIGGVGDLYRRLVPRSHS